MHASDMVEEAPVVGLDSDALTAGRLMAQHQVPGLLVAEGPGAPHSVLAASQVVRFLVPTYVQDDPSLAGVLDEPSADRAVDKLGGVTVRELLPSETEEVTTVEAGDTLLEVAAVLARRGSSLAAVTRGGRLIGVITASRLLERALASG